MVRLCPFLPAWSCTCRTSWRSTRATTPARPPTHSDKSLALSTSYQSMIKVFPKKTYHFYYGNQTVVKGFNPGPLFHSGSITKGLKILLNFDKFRKTRISACPWCRDRFLTGNSDLRWWCSNCYFQKI